MPSVTSSGRQETTIGKIREIAETHRPARVGGTSVDEVTAQMVVRVYDGLNGKRREKFERLSVEKMIGKAFEISSKA